MIFKDRTDAGIQLANSLKKYKDKDCIVFALPRGGIVLAAEIAKRLMLPMDLIIAKKIGHPMNEEYAVCAIAEDGEPVCNQSEIIAADPDWLASATEQARAEIKRRCLIYTGDMQRCDVKNKTAIIVDDGIATGLTMYAAIAQIKILNPSRIVVAIPVAPYSAAQKLKAIADELVILVCDTCYRGSVGAYYVSFPQLDDREVISILNSVKNK